jgi:hypothetical protein
VPSAEVKAFRDQFGASPEEWAGVHSSWLWYAVISAKITAIAGALAACVESVGEACPLPEVLEATNEFPTPPAVVGSVSGAPVAEKQRSLKDIAHAFRNDPRNGVGQGRNIGVLQFNISGAEGELFSVSGASYRPGTVGIPESPVFDPGDRTYDTEWKLLEAVARGIDKSAHGTIDMYTERMPCKSCSGVIDQFRQKFPGVTLNVQWG